VDVQVRFLDDHTRPDEVEQLVLRHGPVAAFDERLQQLDGARPERHRPAIDRELPLRRSQLESAESECRVAIHERVRNAGSARPRRCETSSSRGDFSVRRAGS